MPRNFGCSDDFLSYIRPKWWGFGSLNNSWIIHISNSMHIALGGYKQDLYIKEYTPKNYLG